MGLRKSDKAKAEFNMSSLTDIIFLLLIFFMLTSTLVSPSAINLKLPSSSQSKVQSTQKPITLQATADGNYRINGQNVAKTELATALTATVKRDGRAPSNVTVVLDIDPAANAQILVDAVDAVVKSEAKMVLAVKEKTTN